jgi:hypothetical protein
VRQQGLGLPRTGLGLEQDPRTLIIYPYAYGTAVSILMMTMACTLRTASVAGAAAGAAGAWLALSPPRVA